MATASRKAAAKTKVRRKEKKNVLAGQAHIKTGSLNDVRAIAGYVLAPDGRRYVLVAIVNHPNAGAARPALAWTRTSSPVLRVTRTSAWRKEISSSRRVRAQHSWRPMTPKAPSWLRIGRCT